MRLPGGRHGSGQGGVQSLGTKRVSLAHYPCPFLRPGKSASAIFSAFHHLLEIKTLIFERESVWWAELGPGPIPQPENEGALTGNPTSQPITGKRHLPQRNQGTVIGRSGDQC